MVHLLLVVGGRLFIQGQHVAIGLGDFALLEPVDSPVRCRHHQANDRVHGLPPNDIEQLLAEQRSILVIAASTAQYVLKYPGEVGR